MIDIARIKDFKVGDEVVVDGSYHENYCDFNPDINPGDKGKVIQICDTVGAIGIEFSEPIDRGHDCYWMGSHGKAGCCWWFNWDIHAEIPLRNITNEEIKVATKQFVEDFY